MGKFKPILTFTCSFIYPLDGHVTLVGQTVINSHNYVTGEKRFDGQFEKEPINKLKVGF
jgi:hypothetical protein